MGEVRFARLNDEAEPASGPAVPTRVPLRPISRSSLRDATHRPRGRYCADARSCIFTSSMVLGSVLLVAKYIPNLIPGLEYLTCPNFSHLSEEELEEACRLTTGDVEAWDQAFEFGIVGFMVWVALWFSMFGSHSDPVIELVRRQYDQLLAHAGRPLLRTVFVWTVTQSLEKVVNPKRVSDLLLPVYIWRTVSSLRLIFAALEGLEVELEEEALKERALAAHPVFHAPRQAINEMLVVHDACKDVLWQQDVLISQDGMDRDELAMILLRHLWYPFSLLSKLTACGVCSARWSGLNLTASALGSAYFALSIGTSIVTGMAYLPRVAGALSVYTGNLFRVGERVILRNGATELVAGWVKRTSLLSVTVLDDSNMPVVVPNQLLRDLVVVNVSRVARRVVIKEFTCSARCAPEAIEALCAHLREFGARYPLADQSAELAASSWCWVTGFDKDGYGVKWRVVLAPGQGAFGPGHALTLAISAAARRLCIPLEFNTISVHGMDGMPLAPSQGAGPAGAPDEPGPGPRAAPWPEWTPAALGLAANEQDGGRVTHYLGAPELPSLDDLLPPPQEPPAPPPPPPEYSLRVEMLAVRASLEGGGLGLLGLPELRTHAKLFHGKQEFAKRDSGTCLQVAPECVDGAVGHFWWAHERGTVSMPVAQEVVCAGCLAVSVSDRLERRLAVAVCRMWEMKPGPEGNLVEARLLGKKFVTAGTIELKVTLLELDRA